MVCQINELSFKEFTFSWFQFEAMCLEPIKDDSHTLQVLLGHFTIHYHIIQIDEALGKIKFAQAVLHEPLESSQEITESEGHPLAFKQTHTPQSKSGVLLRLLRHGDLPES